MDFVEKICIGAFFFLVICYMVPMKIRHAPKLD